jgi:hypothetical protein
MDTDPDSRTRSPASVKTPSGPWQDIAASGAGDLAYDPGLIRASVAIIRGEWDSLATDVDAHWLFDALKASPVKRDVKIGRATHLMHSRRKPLRTLSGGADLSRRRPSPAGAALICNAKTRSSPDVRRDIHGPTATMGCPIAGRRPNSIRRSMVDRLSIEAMRLIGVRETAERLAGPSWPNNVILDVFG